MDCYKIPPWSLRSTLQNSSLSIWVLMTGGAEGERLMEKNYFWHVYSLQGLGRHTKHQDWWEMQSIIWERWGFLTISLYWDITANALLSKCIWQILWKNWFGLLRRFRVAFLSSLLLCTCVCVCVCVSYCVALTDCAVCILWALRLDELRVLVSRLIWPP